MGEDCIVVAVLSGGPDSFGYMVEWLSRGCRIHALTFDYGQKASREIDAARRLVEEVNRIAAGRRGWGRVVEHRIVDMSFMAGLWRGTQLTDEGVDVSSEFRPSVVVPLRNVVMASIAAAYAYSIAGDGGRVIVAYGAQLDDARERPGEAEAFYPDCTPECVESLQAAFRICHERRSRRLEIWTPSRELVDKKTLLRRSYERVGRLVYETWSCYRGGRLHCGRCDSCRLRHRAFLEAGLPDCTVYEEPPGDPGEFVEAGGGYVHRSCVGS